MTELNFHVRHEVTPDRVWDTLTALVEGHSFEHIVQVDRQLGRIRQLGLVSKTRGGYRLTDGGRALYSIGARKQEVAMELLHFLHYSLWDRANPLENTFSWSYRMYCESLFQRNTCALSLASMTLLTAELATLITESEMFGAHIRNTKKGAVSLSTNSLNGMNHWLRRLVPPVIENDTFTVRAFCSPELLLMAIGFVSRETQAEMGVDQLLSTERREAICKVCLLETNALDRALDWMLPLYPQVVQPGTRTGSYGRSIHLLYLPTLNDLLQ